MNHHRVQKRIEIVARHLFASSLNNVNNVQTLESQPLHRQPTSSQEKKGLLFGQVAIITGSGILSFSSINFFEF
jgi:hypothetical protein